MKTFYKISDFQKIKSMVYQKSEKSEKLIFIILFKRG